MILRIAGGILGTFLTAAPIVSMFCEEFSWKLALVAGFGIALICISIFASDDRIEDWFGGL